MEQFKQLQQSSLQSGANATTTQTGVYSSVFSPEMKTHYIPPPPPINITIPPPSSYFQQQYSNPPPHYSQPPPPILPQLPIKKEVKREQRSPSPYSPSRPCEDEEEQHFFIKGEWSTCIVLKEQQCSAGLGFQHQNSTHGFPSFFIRIP